MHRFSEDIPSTPEGVRRALLVAVAKVNGFPYLPQAHKDVLRMKTFLLSRGYLSKNIVVMMHDNSVAEDLYPSREKLLYQIDLIVKGTSQHDQVFFYYTGHGDQVPCKHNTEPDFMDEAILTYTGKRIIDNILKQHLVDPLPCGAKLFALWDCCHSHTVLDLEHYNCNSWRAPFKVLSGLAKKTKSLGKRLSASLLRDGSGSRSSTKDDSHAKTESSATDNVHITDLCRVSSPDPFVEKCTPYCPMTLPEKRDMAQVVSLSACRDDELAYDDNLTGETVTKFFIEYLECNPRSSYQDLLSHIQQKVDAITSRRMHAKKPMTKKSHHPHHLQKLSENDVEIEDWHSCERHMTDDNDTSTLSSQQPSYSSHYRLDMSLVVDI